MLQHQMFQRLSNGESISPHITDSMFPQSYALSLTDLVYIAGKRNLWQQPQTAALLNLVRTKKTRSGGWKIDYIYRFNGYLAFDNRRKDSPWLTDYYQQLLPESD